MEKINRILSSGTKCSIKKYPTTVMTEQSDSSILESHEIIRSKQRSTMLRHHARDKDEVQHPGIRCYPYFHQQTVFPGELWVPSAPHVVKNIKEQHPSQLGNVPAYMVTCQPQLFLPCPRLSCSNLTLCRTSCSYMGRSFLFLMAKISIN